MVRQQIYPHSKTPRQIWPKVKALHDGMEAMGLISMFKLLEDKQSIEEIDTGDEPHRGQDNQPMQLENAHSRRLGREHRTAQRLAAEAERIAHRRRLRREDQTAQRSAAEAENAHSRRLRSEEQTAQRSAAEAERIAHSQRRLGREDKTAQRLAAEVERIAHSRRLRRED